MQFTELVIQNMFAYDGESTIDLSGCDSERSIVVVTGPNGYGKTSLLNAVKLLFLGAKDERLLRVGLGKTGLNTSQYVLGVAQRWYGVFNVNHRSAGSVARIALSWTNEGQRHRVERAFKMEREGVSFSETLSYWIDDKPLGQHDDPYARLQQLLPRDLVPYFFFDGEQIQSLAEAEIGRESAEIERLLGLSFVGEVIAQAKAYAKSAGRLGLPELVQVDIAKAEGALREAEARVEAETRSRVALEEEIDELTAMRDRVDADRQRLRGGISEEERARMASRIAMLEGDRFELAGEIAPLLPVQVPALANLRLVGEAFDRIEAHLGAGADAELAARLHNELPTTARELLAELDPAVLLSDPQAGQLAEGLHAALTTFGVSQGGGDRALFSSISIRDVRRLRDRFLIWKEQGPGMAANHADMLRRMRRLTHELAQAQRELDDAEIASDEARARYAELTEQWRDLNDDVIAKTDQKAKHSVEEQRWARHAADARNKIAELEEEHAQRVAQNKAVQLANGVARALGAYHDARRGEIRATVEKRLNEKVEILLGPSQLIKSIRLSDKFVMTFYDDDNEPVARHSISAGMRQLVATAMLWALKEEANRPLPVVIDTPLGRIDQQNRALLVDEYYPRAGDPLILLPTNSEFGEEIFERITHRIRRGYRIANQGGRSAKIERDPRFGLD
jgi:DNA sulfur modification protein DndD